jgi:1-deoxy-D-xylulose-5-phosphate synthase
MQSIYPILSGIVTPTDLHRLSDKELQDVAVEVRQAILNLVSKTGGHLSSNLGTVELTVALYAAFSIPPDKVVWDTGHQAYTHKLLTGRLSEFHTLRKHNGLSGFLRRDENPLDYFGAGHAGTAISAALGFAVARDSLGTSERIVAVTGDAAICSGMCWEALNHAGDLGTDLTVVLNDNRMSISPNVGALPSYLARLRSRPFVQSLAQRAKDVVRRLPGPVPRVAAGIHHGITRYFAPDETSTVFEEMGFEYIGPVDGHDIPSLLEVFRNVRDIHGPVFVHTITVKGKGYEVAEEDARKWHGVIPFDLAACKMNSLVGPPTFTQAFSETLVECAAEDPKVMAITAAMPDGTGLAKFAKAYPSRFYDTGIAEQHAVTFAAGLAASGLKPLCAIYSTFLQRGFDQVLHDVSIQNLPVRFFLDRAGLVGDDGPTHHGTFDLSFLGLIPNMSIMAPRDPDELRLMTRFALNYDTGPIAVRYPRGAGDSTLPEKWTPIEYGKAELLRVGSDVTLCAIGSMVSPCWRAASDLDKSGIEAEVINARFAKPIDKRMILESARKTGRVVCVEENVQTGGFGERVRDLLSDEGIPVRIIAIPDLYVEHGTQTILRTECGLDPLSIANSVREWLGSPVWTEKTTQIKPNR